MSVLETPALYDARPAIKLGDSEELELTNSLLSLSVCEGTEGLFRCEASFGNWGASGDGLGFTLSDRQVIDFGSEFVVDIGAGDKAQEVFRGRVTAFELQLPATRGPELVVLAEDRLQDLRLTRRTRTFEDVSDADIVEQIASDHSLQAEVDLEGETHRIVAQVNQSDLAFLRDRARANNAEVWIEDTTLHVAGRGTRSSSPIRLSYGSNLVEASVIADLAHQRTSITVTGWDVGAKQAIAAEAASAAVSSEVGGGRSGIDLLGEALGEHPEVVTELAASSEGEAQAAADAALRTRARRFVTGHASCEGDARLHVGVAVDLAGFGPGFGGEYIVVEADHVYDGEHGYRTEIRFERPSLQEGP